MLDWSSIRTRTFQGQGVTQDEANEILSLYRQSPDHPDRQALLVLANELRQHHKGNHINTCGISNAKSGRCAEACAFCSQSAHYSTESPKYSLKTSDALIEEAKTAWQQGVREFSLVASGRAMTNRTEIETIKTALTGILEETGMQTCASLGLMSREALSELKDAGLMSVHHNLETARSFHANVVKTHTYDEEVDTIKAAKSLGLYTCCGGIFGMGESWEQRLELALELRDLDVDSVPLNFLNPRPGTPLQDQPTLNPDECLFVIALYRVVLPTKDLIVCGGRALNIGNKQNEVFYAGANGIMIGNYLTTAGREVNADLQMIEQEGLKIRPPPHKPHPTSVPESLRG